MERVRDGRKGGGEIERMGEGEQIEIIDEILQVVLGIREVLLYPCHHHYHHYQGDRQVQVVLAVQQYHHYQFGQVDQNDPKVT